MNITVRQMEDPDRAVWSKMRAALWPDETPQDHAKGIDGILGREDSWGFIARTAEGAPAGFAEIAIRKYANGCECQPVPFLEGIPEVLDHYNPLRGLALVGARTKAILESYVVHTQQAGYF